MTLIHVFKSFFKKKINLIIIKLDKVKILNINPLIFFSTLLIISIIFFTINNLSNKKNIENYKNLKTVTKTNDFSILSNYFISKINSPYKEIKYTIQNNDTIQKILKYYEIKNNDINDISQKLKQKKLSNIYSGRKLSLIYKKLEWV